MIPRKPNFYFSDINSSIVTTTSVRVNVEVKKKKLIDLTFHTLHNLIIKKVHLEIARLLSPPKVNQKSF
jgi:hypothetical protein